MVAAPETIKRLGVLVRRHGIRVDPWIVQSIVTRAGTDDYGRLPLHGTFVLHIKLAPQSADAVLALRDPENFWFSRLRAAGASGRLIAADAGSVQIAVEVKTLDIDRLEALVDMLPAEVLRRIEISRPITVPRPPGLTPVEKAAEKQKGADATPQLERTFGRRARTAGGGIVIGVVDYGFDYLHRSLRNGDHTRILALWDQNEPPQRAPGESAPGLMQAAPLPDLLLAEGREYSAATIDTWIADFLARAGGDEAAATAEMRQAVYAAGYDPFANYYDPQALTDEDHGLHGTHVASVAAGSTLPQHAGVAPGAGIIAVQLGIANPDWQESGPSGGGPWPGGTPNGTRPVWRQYGDIGRLVTAVKFVVYRALALRRAGRPIDGIVVNLSLGTLAGAHDGRSLFESEVDDFVTEYERQRALLPLGALPMLAVVCCAGNGGGLDNHVHARLTPGAPPFRIDWSVPARDTTPNELEIWYAPDADLDVVLTPPPAVLAAVPQADPATRYTIVKDDAPTLLKLGDHVFGCASHHSGATATPSRPSQVDILLDPEALPAGVNGSTQRWRIAVQARGSGAPVEMHAWIERDDPAPSRLAVPGGQTTPFTLDDSTLSSLSCGARTIVVGACGTADNHGRFGRALFSSFGPRPWTTAGAAVATVRDPQRPHVCALGQRVRGARGGTADGTVDMYGTSQAAPQVSGAIARMMQAGKPIESDTPPRRLTSDDYIAALQDAARTVREQRMPASLYPSGADWNPQYGTGSLSTDDAIAALLAKGANEGENG